jgi:hypothetical protein
VSGPFVFRSDLRKHLGDALCVRLCRITMRHVGSWRIYFHAPSVVRLVDRRVQVNQQSAREASPVALVDLPGRRISYDMAGKYPGHVGMVKAFGPKPLY